MATLTDLLHSLEPNSPRPLGEFFTDVVVTFVENEFTIESVVVIEKTSNGAPCSYRLTQIDGNVIEIAPSYVMIQFHALRK